MGNYWIELDLYDGRKMEIRSDEISYVEDYLIEPKDSENLRTAKATIQLRWHGYGLFVRQTRHEVMALIPDARRIMLEPQTTAEEL